MASWTAAPMSLIRTSMPASYNTFSGLWKCFLSATYSYSSIRSIFDRCEKIVVDRVEGHSEGAIDDATVQMDAEVHLHDIFLLQNGFVTSIRGVMCCTMVDTKTRWKSHTSFDIVAFVQTLVPSQSSYSILNAFGNLRQRLPWLYIALCPLSDLTVHLGSLPIFGEEIFIHSVKVALLLTSGTKRICISVFNFLASGIMAFGEQGSYRDTWRGALCRRTCGNYGLLFLRLPFLLLLSSCESSAPPFTPLRVLFSPTLLFSSPGAAPSSSRSSSEPSCF